MKSTKMGVVDFVKSYKRLCEHYRECCSCPFYEFHQDYYCGFYKEDLRIDCFAGVLDKPRKALSIVKKWLRENPERKEDEKDS